MNNCHQYFRLICLCTILFIVHFFCTACNTAKTHMSLADAASDGNLAFVEKNVEADADINQRDSYGYTPLMIATYHNNHHVVDYLLERGADVNLQGKDGRTAIILATCNMNTKIIKSLLKYNPDVSIMDKDSYTALDHANNLNLKTISNILKNYKNVLNK